MPHPYAMSLRMFLSLAAFAAVFLLVACKGDDDDKDDATPTQQGASSTQGPAGSPTAPTGEESPTTGPFTGSTNPVAVPAPSSLGPVVLREIRAASHPGFD